MDLNQKDWERLVELKNKGHQVLLDFLKHLVMVSSAVLAIVVALAPTPGGSTPLRYAVLLLVLSAILFGTFAVYIAVIQWRRLYKELVGSLVQKLHHEVPAKSQGMLQSRYNTLARFLAYAALRSFPAAVGCLAGYAIA